MSLKHLLIVAGLASVAACAQPNGLGFCSPEPGTDQEEIVCSQDYHPDGTSGSQGLATVGAEDPDTE
jgi:hypothetical protein